MSQSRSLHVPLIGNWQTDFYLLGWGVPTFDRQYMSGFLVHSGIGACGSYNGAPFSKPALDATSQEVVHPERG